MREPVCTVQCNPFSGASMFALQCVVQAPVSAGPRLDIVWFFTNTGGNTVPINMNAFPPLLSIASQNQTVMNGELIELTSTITLGRFSDPIHAGRYYCQAQVDGATSSLTPSNALTFTASDSVFNLNPCGDSSGGMNEIDCIFIVGRIPSQIRELLDTSSDPKTIIHITDESDQTKIENSVRLGCASLSDSTKGSMLRSDGRLISLRPFATADAPSIQEILNQLLHRIVNDVRDERSP